LLNLQELDALTEFGLTVTQAKVYLCLNSIGPSSAGNLAKHAKVPRQDIYRVLNELFEFGLIEKEIQMPRRFIAIPITKCINLLVRQRNIKTRIMQKKAIDNLCCKRMVEKEEADNFSSTVIVQKEDPVLLRAGEFLSSVEKSLVVVSPPQKLFPWIFEQSVFFEKAFKRGVQIKILTEKNGSIPDVFQKFLKTDLFEMRLLRKKPTVSFGIYDRKNLILELQGDNGYLASQALVSNNPSIIDLAYNFFKSEWSHAKKMFI
jgi:sugar-specific transcriptional regulator TrmB